jgi:hypothetical protein
LRARSPLLALGAAVLLGGACQTVDLGSPPADINACRPSQDYFVQQLWPNVLNMSYGGKKCSDANCHDPTTGRPLSLIASPQPPLDPTMSPPQPLPADWAANYASTTEQMSCSDVTASDLIIYPTATRPHGGGKLFDITSMQALTIEMWVTASP